jgi:hypothetical protein
MKRLLFALCGSLLVGVVGCEKEAAPARMRSDALPANLLVTTAPTGAVDVVAAKKSAKDGDTVVVKGRVGGQKEPLAANRAIMTIADLSLPTCDKTPMDTCATPWDYCCAPTAEIAAHSVSVQVFGADGRPVRVGLTGVGGIAPLKEVVVAGTAKIEPATGTLVVEAKQIYVAR